VHPAWVDANALPIAASGAVLEFTDGTFAVIEPCEVPLPDSYPALGLNLESGSADSLIYCGHHGNLVHATRLEEADRHLPLLIEAVESSDPFEQDATTQYLIRGFGPSLLFRHMMPPMTLGIRVEGSPAAA
jgi:hypothetical protein